MADCQQGADIFSMITPAPSITISTTMAARKSRDMASVVGVRRRPWPPVSLGWLTPPTLPDDERFRPFGSLQSCPVPVCRRCRVIWLTATDFRTISTTMCGYCVRSDRDHELRQSAQRDVGLILRLAFQARMRETRR